MYCLTQPCVACCQTRTMCTRRPQPIDTGIDSKEFQAERLEVERMHGVHFV